MTNILGATWQETQMFPDRNKTISLEFPMMLRVKSQRSCPMSLVGRETAILGALSRLDDFLMNPLVQGHSGIVPETSWNQKGTNQVTNEDDSQVILILKRDLTRVRHHGTLDPTMLMTVDMKKSARSVILPWTTDGHRWDPMESQYGNPKSKAKWFPNSDSFLANSERF